MRIKLDNTPSILPTGYVIRYKNGVPIIIIILVAENRD